MDVFLARQPIFDLEGNVFGYEILYRDSEQNRFAESDADLATGNVLTRCFIDFGIDRFTGKKRAFINFTTDFIKNNIATIFPNEFLVVEILEDVKVDDKIVECCRHLKESGYMLAIDDFTYQLGYESLIPLVDFIKVDFRMSNEVEREEIRRRFKRPGLSLLAEKVETPQEYESAIRQGFTYFQGYYFAKPEVSRSKKEIPYQGNRLRLVQLFSRPDTEFDELADLIETDLVFSYEILRLVNSAYFGRINEIKSIRYALVLLGMNELRKWLYLAFLSDLGQSVPREIVNTGMLRGLCMEHLGKKAGNREASPELLTIGMFSVIDQMLNTTMDKALAELNFSNTIRRVLTGEDATSFEARCYAAVRHFEQGRWDEAEQFAKSLGITASDLNEAYRASIQWVQMAYK